MKRLCILRHAKSDWGDPGLDDHDRPLNARGQRAAAAMAVYLVQSGIRPDLALCSTARRAQETLAFLSERFDGEVESLCERGLYLASHGEIVGRIAQVDDSVETVLVVGHNPGVEALSVWLDPDGDSGARMPTAALASFRLRVDSWRDLTSGAAELEQRMVPKELM